MDGWPRSKQGRSRADGSLRKATEQDALPLSEIFLAARRAAMPYLPARYTDAEVLGWIRDVVISESRVLVATAADGTATGFASVGDGWLDHLYVAPAAQARGVGSRLLACAKEVSAGGLKLHVFQRNDGARRFYERRGFRLVGLSDGSENEEHEPDAVYRRAESGSGTNA
jgi:GNAT superfamily N-acetyltransferase